MLIKKDSQMKASPLALGFVIALTLATSASASEQGSSAVAAPPGKAEQTVDCSKETWPNFSPSCLRNENSAVEVRLVTATRR
ncbi:MAG: hypothetical protein ABI561_09955 [Bradyrhizobium sp.]